MTKTPDERHDHDLHVTTFDKVHCYICGKTWEPEAELERLKAENEQVTVQYENLWGEHKAQAARIAELEAALRVIATDTSPAETALNQRALLERVLFLKSYAAAALEEKHE